MGVQQQQGFSDIVWDHFQCARNQGPLDLPDGTGMAGCREQGQWMRIQIRLTPSRRIQQAAFITYGCVPAIAAGSWLTEWATGKSTLEVESFESANLVQELGGLPPHRRFCATLAVEAMRAAILDARATHLQGPRS